MTKWTASCLECKANNNGACRDKDCYNITYDPWGDPYPAYVFAPDHDGMEEWNARKRKEQEK